MHLKPFVKIYLFLIFWILQIFFYEFAKNRFLGHYVIITRNPIIASWITNIFNFLEWYLIWMYIYCIVYFVLSFMLSLVLLCYLFHRWMNLLINILFTYNWNRQFLSNSWINQNYLIVHCKNSFGIISNYLSL